MTASSVRAKPSRKSISLHVLRARLIRIRPDSSTLVSTETHAARSTSTKEKKLTSPPSRRSFAKQSPSTVLASRNLRRKRSPKGTEDWESLPKGQQVWHIDFPDSAIRFRCRSNKGGESSFRKPSMLKAQLL